MNFSDLVGYTLKSVQEVGSDAILFESVCGKKFMMDHTQSCCESVYVESIVGDLTDLIDIPILLAEETSGDMENASVSGTWTFYKLATLKGWVDIRWNGESNGFYSESVDFYEVK